MFLWQRYTCSTHSIIETWAIEIIETQDCYDISVLYKWMETFDRSCILGVILYTIVCTPYKGSHNLKTKRWCLSASLITSLITAKSALEDMAAMKALTSFKYPRLRGWEYCCVYELVKDSMSVFSLRVNIHFIKYELLKYCRSCFIMFHIITQCQRLQ